MRRIIILLFALVVSHQMYAKHVVGGDMTYELLDTLDGTRNRYRIVLTMYRDCYQDGGSLTAYDGSATIGIHRGSGNNWRWLSTLSPDLDFAQPQVIGLVENPCVVYPPNLCVDWNRYTFDVTLPISQESYLLSYQRCCRNNSIANIIDPGFTGAAFSIEITPEAQKNHNNSPKFKEFPPILICSGFTFDFDHGATDKDTTNDLLVYEFCAPLAAGGPDTQNSGLCTGTVPNPENCRPPFDEVNYVLPLYSQSTPVLGAPNLTIDPTTGRITGTPNVEGQFVVGVCVKEFRNGQLIGRLRRDFQFNVTTCEPTVFAEIQADANVGPKEYLLNSCGVNTITFVNESYNEDFIFDYLWEFDVNGEIVTQKTRDATVTFPGVGEYEGRMILNEGTECSDTANIFVNVFPSISADYSFEYDTCIAGPVSFMDMSSTGADFLTNWDWDFDDGRDAITQNPLHLFPDAGIRNVKLTVRDNNECETSITKPVDWRPLPPLIIVEPSNFVGCSPADIFFNNLSNPIDDTYTINWDFGDGTMGTEISPTHTYEKEGIYTVNVDITTPFGCMISRRFPNWIRVDSKPLADFDYSPDRPTNFERTISFLDRSVDAIAWQWNFNDEGNAFERNPTYTFQDTGVHFVELIVRHPSGCTDTMLQQIDIIPEVRYFMPNAFTPNADSKNEEFRGIGYVDGIRNFNMTIWSRWGEKVFSSSAPNEGWNGQKNNTGASLPSGVYVYLVTYIDPREGPQEIRGYATLVR